MTVDEARMRVAHVFRVLHADGVQAAFGAATPGKFGGPRKIASEKPDTDRGLYEKYRIERTDGTSAPGQKHHGCEYFVLDLEHDPHALPALRAYAMSCARHFPTLAADLSKKALRLADRWTNAGAMFWAMSNSVSIDPEKARAIVGWTDDDKPR